MERRNQNSRWSRFARDLFVPSRLMTALEDVLLWDVSFSNVGLMMTMYCHSSTAAVLFSFEPHFEEHQGKRLRRYLVNCARRYRQMLESLLHEVIFTFRLIRPKRRLKDLLKTSCFNPFRCLFNLLSGTGHSTCHRPGPHLWTVLIWLVSR